MYLALTRSSQKYQAANSLFVPQFVVNGVEITKSSHLRFEEPPPCSRPPSFKSPDHPSDAITLLWLQLLTDVRTLQCNKDL
jgi:hypothetical protein